MRREVLDALLADRAARRPVAVLTQLESGRQCLLRDDGSVPGDAPGAEVIGQARELLDSNRSATLDTDTGRVFVHSYTPPLKMLLVGAVHVAQALAPMAELAGYEVTVIDPRRAFASDERFPDVQVTHEWPDEALERIVPDRGTAVVTLTHDPKLDDAALKVAVASDAFYIGALGSRRTHAARVERLREAGLGEAQLARIRGPVGLAIGARYPAEIAVAILGEVTQVLRNAG